MGNNILNELAKEDGKYDKYLKKAVAVLMLFGLWKILDILYYFYSLF